MLRLSHIFETEKLKSLNWDNCDAAQNGEEWLLKRLAPHCAFACDVGANAGEWTLALLRLKPDARVFAFEVSPRTALIFEKKLAGRPNVNLFKFGLGETNATLKLNDYGAGSGLTSFISRQGSVGLKPESTYEVPCVRLDSLKELEGQTIDFLKIDTEGFEVPVLKGACELFEKKQIRLVQFEYGGTWIDSRHLFLDAYDLLLGYGLRVGRLLPQGVDWITSYDSNSVETFRYSNFIACTTEVAELLRGQH